MRIAVTGSSGQVARALCELAIDAKAQVLTVSRPNFDLENASTIAEPLRAANPDIIINAAAWTAVDLAETEFARARAINEKGARVVAEVAAELAVPIIQISTNYVFDGTKGTPYVETDPTGPTKCLRRHEACRRDCRRGGTA